MNGEAIMAVGSAVVALTQLAKWTGLPDKWGPLSVLVFSLIGVSFWGWSQADVTRATAFSYFAGWLSVSMTAAGIFGFTRATVGAVMNVAAPPSGGAGSSPTLKP